jgi:hypothetical protein
MTFFQAMVETNAINYKTNIDKADTSPDVLMKQRIKGSVQNERHHTAYVL